MLKVRKAFHEYARVSRIKKKRGKEPKPNLSKANLTEVNEAHSP